MTRRTLFGLIGAALVERKRKSELLHLYPNQWHLIGVEFHFPGETVFVKPDPNYVAQIDWAPLRS